MAPTPQKPSNRLTFEDAIDVHLRHMGGQYQHRIAALYDVNPARVNDVIKGRLHPESRAVALALSQSAA